MKRKILQGFLASTAIAITPLLIEPAILRAPQLWVLVALGILASILQPSYDPFERSPTKEDKGTASQIIWSVYLSQFSALIEAAYFRYPGSFSWDAVSTAALVVMIGGLALRSWGFLTLGRFFTWHISVDGDQPVIESGPYAIVRHPGYLGAYLTYVGSAAFLHAWISSFLASIVLLFAFLRRIHHEEDALRNKLGTRYDSYCDRVKRFIPGLW